MKFDFVSDLHGNAGRYQKLFKALRAEPPDALFLGGDFLPLPAHAFGSMDISGGDFIRHYLAGHLARLRQELGDAYPMIFLIMGNDDPRSEETAVLEVAAGGIWEYIHNRKVDFRGFLVFGYGYVPPTPFRLKDWERYDVSRYVDPGCISPEEGIRSIPVAENEKRLTTIQDDLNVLAGNENLDRAIFLFHAPPYKTSLDLAALANVKIDHVPLDPYVGSIAIRRFIEARRPRLTLHGHIHEAARLSSSWRDAIGPTTCLSAAHDGPELALIRFDPEHLEAATRELL